MTRQLQVIDAHFHMWDLERQHLPWLDGMPSLNRSFPLHELENEYEQLGAEFLGGVYVEVDSDDPLLEDRLVYENNDPKILARMLRAQVGPYMRVPINATGIREPLHTDSAPRGRCMEPSFIAGLRAMADKGLPFELCNRGVELPDMAQAFSQVPSLTVIMDHLGNMPDLSPACRKAMQAMAALPHCYIKVSGDLPVDRDIVAFVRDTFPPDRILYASNWPVVTVHSSLREHWQLMLDIFGPDEDFFKHNAMRAYGIDADMLTVKG